LEAQCETPPLRELHKVGVYVPEVLGDALDVEHTEAEREYRPLEEGEGDIDGDPVGLWDSLLLSLVTAEEE
jgi:hypothetical protein